MPASLLHSFHAVGVVLILTACGYFCAAAGWITREVKGFLSRYIMRVAVPVMCVYAMRSNLSMELLRASGPLLLVPALCSGALWLLSGLLGRAFGLGPRRQSVFKTMCTVSNAMFIGYPMSLELFGEECVPYVMLFFLVNTAYSQLLCVAGIRRACGGGGGSPGAALRSFFTTPPVVGVLLGVLIVLTDFRPPELLMSCARYVNNTVTPLALLLAGAVIREIGLKSLRPDRILLGALGFRFLLAPALTLALCALLGVDGLARSVLVVQSAMPVLVQTVVASTEYGGDEQLAARGVALSTLACFVVIPALMLLL